MYTCANCTKKDCFTKERSTLPENCPCRDTDTTQKSKAMYKGEDFDIAVAACKTEYEGYGIRTRIEEIMEFANHLNFKKIGIAHCIALSNEAAIASKIFQANGFQTETVSCKAGSFGKDELGMQNYQMGNHGPDFEAACNPIGQAMFIEKAGCELAVVIGLCVGHDTLFFKSINIPATYLIVKDRVTGHNPAVPLYADSYFHKKLYPPTRKTGNIVDPKK